MNVNVRDCPNCSSSDLRITVADAMGGEGPDLLPGVGGFFRRAQFAVVVCCGCGLTRFFVTQEEIEKVRQKWEPLRD
jgi:hypothetical protein